ncbi:hypothetical protein HEK616_68740 [Streptomyces nigrescens]|uniref:Integral membrane protein n=1 Tax=Streptomyces nigrescens TaxID=1920 RepID=A0ABM8A432_STRNI|nr:hypothetical protein HEK616_68740 [Streptomyces nigrescens]
MAARHLHPETSSPATLPSVSGQPRALAALRRATLLVGGYLGLSVLTLAAVVALRDDAAVVNDAVWVRTVIVVASAVVMFVSARRAARGSRPAYRRVRILSGVMLVAIAVIIAIPGSFPLWLKVEQGVCGIALLGVALIVNGRQVRSSFAAT